MMAHDAGRRIDREADDLFRAVVRDVLDVDAAFGRNHERHFAGFAVDQDREIKLLVDIGAFLDVEPVDLLAVRPGLHRHQRRAQHLLGEFVDLGDRFGDAHATLVAGGGFLELALAAAAGMDLAFYHPDGAGKGLGCGIGIGRPQHRHALRDRHPEFVQQRLGLVFMDIHLDAPRTLARRMCEFTSALLLAYHIPTPPQPPTAAPNRFVIHNVSAVCRPLSGRANPARSSCRRRPGPAPRRPTCRRLRGPCQPVQSRQCARRPSSRSRRARRHTCPLRRIRR